MGRWGEKNGRQTKKVNFLLCHLRHQQLRKNCPEVCPRDGWGKRIEAIFLFRIYDTLFDYLRVQQSQKLKQNSLRGGHSSRAQLVELSRVHERFRPNKGKSLNSWSTITGRLAWVEWITRASKCRNSIVFGNCAVHLCC